MTRKRASKLPDTMSAAEKIQVNTEVPNPEQVTRRSSDVIFTVVVLSLGILGGLVWFARGFLIPETDSAWFSGDPHDYVAGSLRGYQKAFYYVHWRSFGYPFYLAVFREFFPGDHAFRLPAFLFQFMCYLASSWFLVFALRRQGMYIPAIALALLFAHPAFAGLAGIPMTEALTTSMYSVAFALGVMLLHDGKWLVLRSALFGMCLGIVICMRPPALGFIGALTVFTGLVFGLRSFTRSCRIGMSLGKMFLFFAVSAAAFAPFIGHTLANCERGYGTTCLVQPGLPGSGMKESLSFRANRVWYSPIASPGTVVFCSNKAMIFGDCEFSKENPIGDMLACYQKHYASLPLILGERLLGLFDHRHIHSYANKETTPLESTVIRIFSAIGLVGLLAVSMMWIFSLREGRAIERSYLLFPLVYLAGQINFHPESRYILPVMPMLFICGISALVSNPFSRRWQMGLFVVFSLIAVRLYTVKITEWDAQIKEPACRTGYQFTQG